MSGKVSGVDLVYRMRSNTVMHGLKKTLPKEWASAIEIVAVQDTAIDAWLRSENVLHRVTAFKALHGDAAEWNLTDSTVIEKARDCARWFAELLELRGGVSDAAWQLDLVCAVCDLVGVEYPRAITANGAINRALCPVWWRRSMRKKVARVVEAGAIKIGLVNRSQGVYCSGAAVERRAAQLKRNAAMMGATLLRNEAGQVFKLSDLAALSTANPVIRGHELMTRIRGCEEFAGAAGHVGYFLTGTAPSRFHAVRMAGKGPYAKVERNPSYDGVSTPRDAQIWLREQWAKTRAQWARKGVKVYGFRVAEPHHDGCPHWHLLLWFEDDAMAMQGLGTFGEKWLSDGGEVTRKCTKDKNILRFSGVAGSTHERGALKNRVNFKRMEGGKAAGYVAKYIAKSIGNIDIGTHLDTVDGEPWELDTREVKGWQRVDAWAATWGIRQFQAIGQPSVTVWRELRRVTKDQIDRAAVSGDALASKLWHAVQKFGVDIDKEDSHTGREVKAIKADWCAYMVCQGGAALKRGAYKLLAFFRETVDHENGYGETVTKKSVVGCELPSGRVLVSRRQGWTHVGREVGTQSSAERAALGTPWTRFNNCTARLGGQLRAAMLGLSNGGGVGNIGGCSYGA